MRFTDGSVFGYSPMLWPRIRVTGSLLQMIDASSVQHAQSLDFPCNKKKRVQATPAFINQFGF
jgi:hypothetical protein